MSSPGSARVFWGEIAPSEHLAQFYDDEESFLITLAGFISEGVRKGEAAIVVATPEHLSAVASLLANGGVDLAKALAEDRYIPMDAEMCLSTFMVKGRPDEKLFAKFVERLLRRASRNERAARVFGEMVALLWAEGNREATVRLENLWNDFCRRYGFCLLCSYPKAGFPDDPRQSIAEICAHHSRYFGVDPGWMAPAREMA